MTSFNSSINSTYGYNLGGITNIWLLNIEDFICCKFKEDKLNNLCLAESIIASSHFIKLEAINESNFTETYSDKIYSQKLSTFIYPLTGDNLAKMLDLKAKKHLVIFQNKNNQFFGFGNEGGASIAFSQQTGKTNDIQGYSIVIEKKATSPLFELLDIVIGENIYRYTPCFEDGVYCPLINGKTNGTQIATYALKYSIKGEAVDINGNLCKQSELPQAIMMLEGFKAPDGNFLIEGYYNDITTHIMGYSITRLNELCKAPSTDYIKISPKEISFDGNLYTNEVEVYASSDWNINTSNTDKEIAYYNYIPQNKGKTTITFKAGNNEGAGYFEFQAGDKKETLTVFNRKRKLTMWLSKYQIIFTDTEDGKKVTEEEITLTYINASKNQQLTITPLSKQIASFKDIKTEYNDNKITVSFTITKGTEKGNEYLKLSIGETFVQLNIINMPTSPQWVLNSNGNTHVWDKNGVWIADKHWKM